MNAGSVRQHVTNDCVLMNYENVNDYQIQASWVKVGICVGPGLTLDYGYDADPQQHNYCIAA